MTTFPDESRTREAFTRAGQGHVFAFWPELNAGERRHLLEELARVDLPLVASLGRLVTDGAGTPAAPRFEPPDVFPLARDAARERDADAARGRGRELLARGRVGYLLVAGGQASRLGYDGPKGTFPVGPVTGRSLFEIFARRLIAARAHHGQRPLWYVMTSQANDASTREFFERHRWFSLDPADVVFFSQAMLPALDTSGRILMARKDEPFLAPNGHGGTLVALAESGALDHAREHGVEVFSYFQVDNPLARPADTLFLGLHAASGAQMSSKVVRKRHAGEKVGVLGKADGRLTCIEYSDLPAELRDARDASNELVFGAGNIAVHAIDRAFVESLTRGGLKLPWHVAKKQIQSLDERGAPAQVSGYKFETFVFDALSFVDRSVTLEVDRGHEFSPVKNASGEDSPQSARADQCRLYAEWVKRAGLPLPAPDEHGHHPIEVDPCVAEDLETFLKRRPATPRASPKGHLYE